jgi:hypothetical protein
MPTVGDIMTASPVLADGNGILAAAHLIPGLAA